MPIRGRTSSWNPRIAPLGALTLLLAATGARADLEADRLYCESLQGGAKVVCLRDLKTTPTPTATPPTPAAATRPAAPAADAKAATVQAGTGTAPYKVVDGYKVDPETLKGFRTWRAAACDRCHGANQEGMVGPSLISSLKTLSKEDFVTTVTKGRLEKGMPSFGQAPNVASNIDQLYAYLKGRSDGAITKAHVEAMP